jgi:hypothetical protein
MLSISSSFWVWDLMVIGKMVSALVLLVIEDIFAIETRLNCDIAIESSQSSPVVLCSYKFFWVEIKLCLGFNLESESESLGRMGWRKTERKIIS